MKVIELLLLAGSPESKFTAPGGIPQSLIISTISITVPGVITSGLQITEQPAARAQLRLFLQLKLMENSMVIMLQQRPQVGR